MYHLGEDSFAGYATSDGKIVKHSKVNWPKSTWYHVFGMCQRENISLRYSPGSNSYRFEVTLDDETTCNIEHSKAFSIFLKALNFNLLKILGRSLVLSAGFQEKLVDILMKNALKLFSPITIFRRNTLFHLPKQTTTPSM